MINKRYEELTKLFYGLYEKHLKHDGWDMMPPFRFDDYAIDTVIESIKYYRMINPNNYIREETISEIDKKFAHLKDTKLIDFSDKEYKELYEILHDIEIHNF